MNKKLMSIILAAGMAVGMMAGCGDFSDQPETSEGSQELTETELITLANEAFDNAQAAMQSGNWARYGEYLTQLEQYLNMLAE